MIMVDGDGIIVGDQAVVGATRAGGVCVLRISHGGGGVPPEGPPGRGAAPRVGAAEAGKLNIAI